MLSIETRHRILDLAIRSTHSAGNDAVDLAADMQVFIEEWLRQRRSPKRRRWMILLALAGISLVAGMAFAVMGDIWGWFLWWVLAIGLGVVWAIREGERGSRGEEDENL